MRPRPHPKSHTGKAPLHQKWVEKDFVVDTLHLHWLARMMYRALLQSAWVVSSRPNLPDDDAQLQIILGVTSDVWNEHRAAVRAMFKPQTVDGVKVLTQNRLQRDWQTIEDYRKQQSELAKRKWEKQLADDARGYAIADAKGDAEGQPLADASAGACAVAKAHALAMPGISIGEGEEALSSLHPQGKENSKAAGQEQSAIERLQGVCFELVHKTPKPADVRRLLDRFPADEIEAALREYVDGLYDDDDIRYAEKTFFADDGGAAVILARRNRATA